MPQDVDVTAAPSGTGCVECDAAGGWWVHLRRCAACGHVGCCDSSIGQHASAHAAETGHALIQSFEPGEEWWWDYSAQAAAGGPALAPPTSRPLTQPSPGPADRVPEDWREMLRAAGR